MRRDLFHISLWVVLFMVVCRMSAAAECVDYGQSMRWLSTTRPHWDYMNGYVVDFPYIYGTGEDYDIYVIDATDPYTPTIIGTHVWSGTSPGSMWYRKIFCHDGLLFKPHSPGLRILDLSDPLHPALIDSVEIENPVVDIEFVDQYALALQNWRPLILDLSDPDGIEVVGSWDIEGGVGGIAVEDHWAYITSASGIKILDITDPFHPVVVDTSLTGGYSSPAVSDGVLITRGSGDCFHVFDVSNPLAPTQTALVVTHYNPAGFAIDSGMVAVSTYDGVELYDLSVPASPVLVEIIGISIMNAEPTIYLQDGLLFHSGWNSVSIVDIAGGHIPDALATVSTPARLYDVAVRGDFAFAVSSAGLTVFDMSVPATPAWAGSAYLSHYAAYIGIWDDLAVVCGDGCLSTIDISDPTLPQVIGTLDGLPEYANDLSVVPGKAWFTTGAAATAITGVDLRHPSQPVLTHQIALPDGAVGIVAAGNYLHVTSGWSYDLIAIDGPAAQIVSSLEFDMEPRDLVVKSDQVLICHPGFGLSFVDISDPLTPEIINFVDIHAGVEGLSIVGDQAVIEDGDGGLVFLDITDSLAPVSYGAFWEPLGGHAVLSTGDVLIWDWRDPTMMVVPAPCPPTSAVAGDAPPAIVRLEAVPNPFNPRTSFTFDLPRATHCRLTVYDLRGRAVRDLCDTVLPAGRQTLVWNGRDDGGRDLPSGAYVARINHAGGTGTCKAVLLR